MVSGWRSNTTTPTTYGQWSSRTAQLFKAFVWKPESVPAALSQCVSQTIVLGVGAGTTAMHLFYDVLLEGFGMEVRHYDPNHIWAVEL